MCGTVPVRVCTAREACPSLQLLLFLMGRFVVIGANGGTGYQIAAQLARAGNDVIAVVRNPGSASAELKALTSLNIVAGARLHAYPNLRFSCLRARV